MKTEPLDEFESQLAAAQRSGAPATLRREVLNNVERELRAARWDRRLARAAVLLLFVGLGMNAATVLIDSSPVDAGQTMIAAAPPRDSLIETAIVVSEATDAATGRRFARQMAAYSGRELTAQEVESLDSLVTNDRG